MRKMNKATKKSKMLTIAILMGVGLVFFGIGVLIFANNYNFAKNGVETEATITRIVVRYDSEGNSDHDVYVSYSAGGKEYTDRKLGSYVAGMREGDIIPIRYMPNDPTKIHYGKMDYLFAGIFGGVGFALFVGGGAYLIVFVITVSRLERLSQDGYTITAKIDEIKTSRLYINDVKPLIIFCVDQDGNKYKSRYVYAEESEFTYGDEITVCIDRYHKNRYEVDVDTYLDNKDSLQDDTSNTDPYPPNIDPFE